MQIYPFSGKTQNTLNSKVEKILLNEIHINQNLALTASK